MDSRASFTELAISHSELTHEFEDQTLRCFGSWDPHPSTKTLSHNILHIFRCRSTRTSRTAISELR